MIKCFCDKCEKRITDKIPMKVVQTANVYDAQGEVMLTEIDTIHDLCEECYEKYKKLDVDTKDFMAMSDEEIELALYTFKVGDQVITDDGRVGTIYDICTCDKCKERGFYEPKVKTEVGLYDIWITNMDKHNSFKSFYKIGDKVFGNIDEKEEKRLEEDIYTRKHEIISLEAQLNMLSILKKEK